MTRAALIRQWVAAQGTDCTARQIAEGIGHDPLKTSFSVNIMLRDGLLQRVSNTRPCTYVVARDLLSTKERGERISAGHKASPVSRKTAEERRLAREQRKTASMRARKAKADKARAVAVAKERASLAARAERAARIPSKPAPVEVRAQTVDEFMAQGGRIEVLPGFVQIRPAGAVNQEWGIAA